MMRSMLVSAILVAVLGVAHAAEPVPLKKGERIVFLGDSITQGGGGPKGYVTLIKNALTDEKHKELGIEVINAGISGNKVPDLQKRLQKDVLDKNRRLWSSISASTMFGMVSGIPLTGRPKINLKLG